MNYRQFVRLIRTIITAALGDTPDIRDEKMPGDRPYLIVTSEAFEGMTLKERQDMVRVPLEAQLGPDITRISLIETYTPRENPV